MSKSKGRGKKETKRRTRKKRGKGRDEREKNNAPQTKREKENKGRRGGEGNSERRRGRVAGVGRGEQGEAPQRQTKENHHLCTALQMVADAGEEDSARQMQATQNTTSIIARSACRELS